MMGPGYMIMRVFTNLLLAYLIFNFASRGRIGYRTATEATPRARDAPVWRFFFKTLRRERAKEKEGMFFALEL